jgi:hypothetical protein
MRDKCCSLFEGIYSGSGPRLAVYVVRQRAVKMTGGLHAKCTRAGLLLGMISRVITPVSQQAAVRTRPPLLVWVAGL